MQVMLPQIYIQDKTWWCFFKNNCKTMGVTLYRGTPGGQIPKFWEKMVCRNDVTRKIGVSWRIFSYWWNLTPRNKPVKVFYFLKMDLRTDSSVVWQLILNHNVMFCPKCNISGKSFVKFEAHIIRKNIKNLGGSFHPPSPGDARVNKQQNPNTNCQGVLLDPFSDSSYFICFEWFRSDGSY